MDDSLTSRVYLSTGDDLVDLIAKILLILTFFVAVNCDDEGGSFFSEGFVGLYECFMIFFDRLIISK